MAITPSAPRTSQTVTATPSGFTDADGDPLTYHYQWLRNGTEIAGATTSSLNLNTPGAGDRGDKVRVEVYATDGRGAASDAAVQTVTVANTPPTAGTASIKPASPSTNDVLKAVPAGFADVDGDALTYTYQWYRNGTAIAGATGRTLDLSLPGNGDLGDTIDVDVTGVDTSGATSAAARAQQNISGTNSTPVEGTVNLSPPSPKTAETVTASPAGFRDPDGDALTYRYQWFRNGTAIAGATAAALNLSGAGAGDRGDALKVEVTATDTHAATSDPAVGTATVANTVPAAGTAQLKPTSPSSEDFLTATASGFSDADGDALSYRYQWFRNGSAIGGANGRTLDLSQPGNGDPGDTIEVDVTAVDGVGGTSSHVRASQVVGSGASHAVASYGFEEPVGNTVSRRERQSRRRHRRRDAQRRGPLRPRAVLRRDGRHRHRPRRLRAPPDDRDDARGLGEADGRHRLAQCHLQGEQRGRRIRAVRKQRSRTGRRCSSAAQRASAARRSSTGIAGRTSRPRSTARRCACS